MTIRRIKPHVFHQGIGGKDFIIDYTITNGLTNDKVFNLGLGGNIACYNFLRRRPDFNRDFPHKLYYGKVDGLGYVVAEDELE